MITILAEPNLTALSGETASFLAGGEFPIPIAGNTSNGQTTITVEFKTFGVSLAVVPTVMSPTLLNLRVRPEVSQLTTNGAVSVPVAGGTLTIPALTVRQLELRDHIKHDDVDALVVAAMQSQDAQEGMKARLEKRAAKFQGK